MPTGKGNDAVAPKVSGTGSGGVVKAAQGVVDIPTPQVQMFGLVRDKNGKPKIDGNPRDLPEPIKDMLTAEERVEYGVDG